MAGHDVGGERLPVPHSLSQSLVRPAQLHRAESRASDGRDYDGKSSEPPPQLHDDRSQQHRMVGVTTLISGGILGRTVQ